MHKATNEKKSDDDGFFLPYIHSHLFVCFEGCINCLQFKLQNSFSFKIFHATKMIWIVTLPYAKRKKEKIYVCMKKLKKKKNVKSAMRTFFLFFFLFFILLLFFACLLLRALVVCVHEIPENEKISNWVEERTKAKIIILRTHIYDNQVVVPSI